MSAANDIARAKGALLYFHARALSYPDKYDYTAQQLYDHYSEVSPKFLQYLGSSLSESGLSDSDIQIGMEQIADDGQGKVPAHPGDFFDFLISGAKNKITSWDVVKAVGEGVAQATGAVAKVTGDTLSNAAGLVKYVPFLLFAGLAYFIFSKARRA